MERSRYGFAATVVAILAAGDFLTTTQARAADSRGIEEIVVRARKREELIQDTPIAVTALSDRVLREANVQRIDDITKIVPNFSFDTGGAGQSAQLTLRGVGTTGGTGVAFDPGVGLYIDGVFMPRAQVSVFDALDIQQVEVLRGPQGTLFGKNTVGGAVSITTAKPTEELSGSIFVRPGNLNAIRTRAVLNIPIDRGWFEDKLFTRFALATRNRDGFTFNETFNQDWGEESGITFLGSLRLIPRDDVTLDVSGTWFRDHTHNPAGHCFVIRPDSGLGQALGFFDECRRTRPRRITTNENAVASSSSWGVWGNLSWDVGDLGPLEETSAKLIGSWRRQLSPSRNDFDGTRVEGVAIANYGGDDSNADGRAGEAEQIQQEIQFNANALDGRLKMVTGLFGFWEDADRSNGIRLPLVNTLTENQITTSNWTWALFGQATAEVTDWLSLTAGIRYTQDKKGAAQINTDFAGGPPGEITGRVSDAKTFKSWTPMASIALFAPDRVLDAANLDHFMTYFTYSRGFKGGGLNAVLAASTEEGLIPFGPETLDNFEVGIKTFAFDRRLSMNVAFFESQYDDIQRSVIRTAPIIDEMTGEATGVLVNNLTLNAAEATMRGIEVEGTLIPIDHLTLQGSFGYIDATYDSFGTGCENQTDPDVFRTCPASQFDGRDIDRTGEPFLRTPSYTAFLSAQYAIPIEADGWLAGNLTPRIEWSYRDRELFGAPEIPEGSQPSLNLFNARLSYSFLEDRAQIALWGLNLSDELYYANFLTATVNTFGNAIASYAPPRTYGAELSYRF